MRLHFGAALNARLIRSLINAMLKLKEALPAFRIDIIGNGRASGLDRLRKHLRNRRVQLARPIGAQPRSHSLRMDARAEEGLIRVDISNSAYERLIQQQRLDAGSAALQSATKSSTSISSGSGPRRATRLGNSSESSIHPNWRLSSNSNAPRSSVKMACVCLPGRRRAADGPSCRDGSSGNRRRSGLPR